MFSDLSVLGKFNFQIMKILLIYLLKQNPIKTKPWEFID